VVEATVSATRDSSIIKVDSRFSPHSNSGQVYLASGTSLSMRLSKEEPGPHAAETARDYETVGYVIEGRAELESEGQRISLGPGDSWVVPRGALHRYRIIEKFVGIEATSPPAQVHGRDASPR